MGIIGEFAGGANSQCESAVTDLFKYMGQNTDVWLGAIWWGGGRGEIIIFMQEPSGSLCLLYFYAILRQKCSQMGFC